MANGTDWTVEWYRTARGEARGHALREPHSKSLGDGLFELRGRRGVRLFYTFRAGQRIIVLDGVVQKRRNIPAEVLARVRGSQRAV